MAEQSATDVSQHVESCSRCQLRIDSMVPNVDSLLKALRGRVPVDSISDPQLQRLISRAGKIDPKTESAPAQRSRLTRSDCVELERFADCLRRSRLFEADDVEELCDSCRPSTAAQFAKELVSRKKLTSFQAGMLLRGRWKGLVLGSYVLLQKLGRGGMGHVYKARHRVMGRTVCLKVLNATSDDDLIERFRREAQAVAALSHPNIVAAHDADEDLGVHFLVMEFIPGRDLARYVAENGPFQPDEAVRIVMQVARALEYAHEVGIIHRDIKPHNLLLDDSGTMKILDMGLARFDSYLCESSDGLTNNASMTSTGVVIGTVDYMSPEQALNSRRADNRSDIYSLGCTLHYLIAGEPVYAGETVMEKLVAHREEALPDLKSGATVSPSLEAIFRRMIAKDPNERYATMADVCSDLEAHLDGRKPVALQLAARARRKWERPAVGAVGLATLLTIGGFDWFDGTTDDARNITPASTGASIGASPVSSSTTDFGDESSSNALPAPSPQTTNGGFVEQTMGSELQPPPLPDAHPNVLANGGPGRALVVVPIQWFYEDQFVGVTAALRDRGVDIVVASSRYGEARPKHGGIKPVLINVRLDEVDVVDFDVVVYIGGNCNEFTHKNPSMQEQTKDLIADSLDQPRVIVGIDNGYTPVREALGSLECKQKRLYESGDLQVGYPKGHRIRWIEAVRADQAPTIVAIVFDELLTEEEAELRRR